MDLCVCVCAIFSLFPKVQQSARSLKYPGRNREQITRNTSRAYAVQHVVCPVTQIDSSAVKFDRTKIKFILAVFHWLKLLTYITYIHSHPTFLTCTSAPIHHFSIHLWNRERNLQSFSHWRKKSIHTLVTAITNNILF